MRGRDGTHRKRRGISIHVITQVSIKNIQHLGVARVQRHVERITLFRRVEISSIRDSISSDVTVRRQRGTAVTFPGDPQNVGSGRFVVCFYDPRFVPLYANCGIVTDPGFHPILIQPRLIRVYREATRRRETGVESDEDRFNCNPSMIITSCA